MRSWVEISKPSVEGPAWFLLAPYHKMWKEKWVEKKLLSKKEPKQRFKKFSVYPYWGKKRKRESICEENTKRMAGLSLAKKFMGLYKKR